MPEFPLPHINSSENDIANIPIYIVKLHWSMICMDIGLVLAGVLMVVFGKRIMEETFGWYFEK